MSTPIPLIGLANLVLEAKRSYEAAENEFTEAMTTRPFSSDRFRKAEAREMCAEMELRHWLLRYFEESERLRK